MIRLAVFDLDGTLVDSREDLDLGIPARRRLAAAGATAFAREAADLLPWLSGEPP